MQQFFLEQFFASGGNKASIGGAEISANGVCWSTTANPVTTDSKTVDAIGTSQFLSSLSGLAAGTTYHVRAYATNSGGTAYGEDVTFTTLTSNTVSDVEGNIYNIKGIGTQVWMSENLKTTKYRNGDLIGTTNLDISFDATGKYQWAYDGIESNVAAYGRLYTWYTVSDSRNICPTGWHVPNNAEWTTLTTLLGGDAVAGDKLRESGTTHWGINNTGATNETGFTALPGGDREMVVTSNTLVTTVCGGVLQRTLEMVSPFGKHPQVPTLRELTAEAMQAAAALTGRIWV